MTSYTTETINRHWSEFGNLMGAAHAALRKRTHQHVDDQDACDVIGIAFESYRKYFSDGPPVNPGASIRLSLQFAVRSLLGLKTARKRHLRQLKFDFADQEDRFDPDHLNETLSSLPATLRETAYAVATLGSASVAADVLGVTCSCVCKRLKKIGKYSEVLQLCG